MSASQKNLTLWVGNIPETHATEDALMDALRQALVAEGEIDEGGDTGCVKCTVRLKPEKKNGSWALLDFRDEEAMSIAMVVKIALAGADGVPVVLDIKPAQIKERLAKSKRRLKRNQSYGTGALMGVVEKHQEGTAKMAAIVEDSPVRAESQSLWVGGIPLRLADEAKLREACEGAGMAGIRLCNVRVKPEKKNGNWAMLGFQDATAMQEASKIPVVVKDDEGEDVSLRIKLPSGEQKLEVGAWVGSIPRRFATEQALRAELLAHGMTVKSCTIRVKAEKPNGSWALLTFADAKASEKFFAAARRGAVTLPGDTGPRVALRMQEFRREKARTVEANALMQMHVMMLQGKVASAADACANQIPVLPGGKSYHFYLCGHRISGEAQCLALCSDLRDLGFQVLYNSDCKHFGALRKGVSSSMCLLIFLSGRKERDGHEDPHGEYEGTFTQEYCHEEMSAAHDAGLCCVRVMETEADHGQPDFGQERMRALQGTVHRDAKQNVELLEEDWYIPFRRKGHERSAMVAEIARQLQTGPVLKATPTEPEPEVEHDPEPGSVSPEEVATLAGQLQGMKITKQRSQDLAVSLVSEGYYDSDVVCEMESEDLKGMGFKPGEIAAVKRFKNNQLEAISKLKVQMHGKVGQLRRGIALQHAAEEGVPPVSQAKAEPGTDTDDQEMIVARLQGLKLKELRQRAKEAGISPTAMEEAMDSHEPEVALIRYLMEKHAVAATKAAVASALLAELQGLTLKDLRQRAKEAGISPTTMEEAMDSDEPEGALIRYLQQLQQQQPPPQPQPEPEPEPEQEPNLEESHGKLVLPALAAEHDFHFVFSNKTAWDSLCLEVQRNLALDGVRIWQQRTNIPKDSANWFSEWYPSATRAHKIVCFISVDYLKSTYCMKEWRVAESKNKLLVVACEPLSQITAVDPSAYPQASDALAYLDGGGQVIFNGKDDIVAELHKFI